MSAKIKSFTLRIAAPLWYKLQKKKEREGFSTMSEYLRYIIKKEVEKDAT